MGRAEKQSLNPDNDYANRVRNNVRKAGPSPTVMNNAWRKAKELDPTLEYRISFMEWRREYERNYYNKRKQKANSK